MEETRKKQRGCSRYFGRLSTPISSLSRSFHLISRASISFPAWLLSILGPAERPCSERTISARSDGAAG